ncbi:MAG: type II toxin-antitoxin system YafQ family toxin [Bacteroidia bacterium]|nr:type II toxin-antitoxin system YafQ family toxin [Candidatus Limimorpha caballi]MDO5341321.1 type II toxin-antitoxin system YafQ family toxin [Bacteroidia bacterium]
MYRIKTSRKFDRALVVCSKRGYDMKTVKNALEILAEKGELPPEYKTHKLIGEYKGCLECHLKPDWVMIWEKHENELVMLMVNTGTHTDVFKKY